MENFRREQALKASSDLSTEQPKVASVANRMSEPFKACSILKNPEGFDGRLWSNL